MKVALCVISVFYTLEIGRCVPELQLLQIVFAHKTYAPILDLINSNDTCLPSNLTYEHFTFAPLSMPKIGMLNMYNLGVHLRQVYGQFLGDIYTRETMKMKTASYPLSMMSGQLVNAGLWPAKGIQKWSSDMNWQPIPTDYVSAHKDTQLLGIHCPSFASETKKVLNTDQVRATMAHYSALFEFLSEQIGMKIQQPSEIALLYAVLETKADLNQSLPHWAMDIFPHGWMYNISLLEYDLLSQTLLQRQLNGGTMLKEILANSLSYVRGDIPNTRKLMIYSGNERNIVGILKGLNLWSPHIPNEASSIIFEMYFDNETQSYGMKINYYTGVEGDTLPLNIPNCTEICPIEVFLNSIFDVLPRNEHILCNWKKINFPELEDVKILDDTIYNRSATYNLDIILSSLLLIITLSVS